MVHFYAIDRLDGSDWAVLEDAAARTFTVPRAWLPGNAHEGDVVLVESDNGVALTATVLRITVDDAATAERGREAERLRREIPQGPKGDVSL